MVKLSTQPTVNAKTIALRSGFYALPFSSGSTWLFARSHSKPLQLELQADDNDQSEAMAPDSHQLFVTGLPLGLTEKGLKKLFTTLYPSNKLQAIEMLPSTTSPTNTLLQRELVAASTSSTILPLFSSSSSDSSSPYSSSSPAAILTFTSVPQLPPPAYPSNLSLPLPKDPRSYLSFSKQRYSLARPHRSAIIAHTDSWMQSHDARKLAASVQLAQPSTHTPSIAATKGTKQGKKGSKKDPGPLPGSAAHALAIHAAEMAKRSDRAFNPDAGVPDEEGWTLVSRGGRHGTSLLPTGVEAGLDGYGGKSVKVAPSNRGGERQEQDLEPGQRKIVGDGFYRFTKADERKRELAQLKDRFEQDKRKLGRFRAERGAGKRSDSRGQSGRYKPY